MKRDATKVIWRTVVFAGAMLGAPACSKKQPQTTPAPKPADTTTTGATTVDPQPDPAADTATGSAADPAANEDCRVRGCDEDGGGGAGRGFVLS